MAKTKGIVLGADHVNHVGPSGAFVGNKEGFTPSTPAGYSGKTVADQYRGDGVGIDTRPLPGSGTPYQDSDGNPNEFKRTAEGTGRYGIVLGENGQNMNDPASNGSGTIFDGAKRENGYMTRPAPTFDSPVPQKAPRLDPSFIPTEVRGRLGGGNESAAKDGLVAGGGVMSRGMVGTSKTSAGEDELTRDDTLRGRTPK
jgi:hypothetical protein